MTTDHLGHVTNAPLFLWVVRRNELLEDVVPDFGPRGRDFCQPKLTTAF